MRVSIAPSEISGVLAAPPSKSMAHRVLICAGLAAGESRIENLSDSDDIRATCRALTLLGAQIGPADGNAVRVRGVGGVCPAVSVPVDCGESGSTLRFLIPVFARSGKPVRFTGHGRLMERPQTVYADLFAACGLKFTHTDEEISLWGALPAGEYTVRGDVSSQFISGLLFALPLARGDSVLHITPPFESRSYVALTLRALADFGVSAAFTEENTLSIPGNQTYRPCNCTVEGDASQAAFPAVLGAVRGGVTVTGLRPDSMQGDRVILDILARCGARFTRRGDAVTFEKSPLHAIEIDLADCPDLGPVLMALGTFFEGTTVIRNAGRLRMKESDRIEAMQTELGKLGAEIASTFDTITIHGAPQHTSHASQGHNDPRVVMALAVAALAAGIPAAIDGAEAVRKSWPDFWQAIRALGAKIDP